MAHDRDSLLTEVKSLTLETKRDLLKAIQDRADGAPSIHLVYLSYAFALLEGASNGVLPNGVLPPLPSAAPPGAK